MSSCRIHQYRYHFKKWKIKKRITTVEKDDVITVLGNRRRQHGIGTSNVQLEQGGWRKPVDKKQLKRYINDSIRAEKPLSIRPGLFFSRTLPYSAFFRRLGGHTHDNPSPRSNGPPTPASSYLRVSSPQDQRDDASPQEGLSPTTQLLHKKVLMDRAQLLLDGRDLELMKQMSRDERRVTADWLHDFWMYSFITTKYWGKGPKIWTLPLITFKTRAGVINDLPEDHSSRSLELGLDQPLSTATAEIEPPTQLCNWSIHVDYDNIRHQHIDSRPGNPADDHEDRFDVEDDSTWRKWGEQRRRDLTNTLTEGLQAHAFTIHQAGNLPLALDQIASAVSGSRNGANVEAVGFTIMTRNVNALSGLMYNELINPQSLRDMKPFHLAAKFLDGSKACCGVMFELLVHSQNRASSIGVNYTDNLGLTVLDTLFVTILRSHSSASPPVLGRFLSVPDSNFEGVDVDICGRWDAGY
ncbi:hypothetical protein INS49_007309 [Diaporthe citri]|uniref:uncharacterized protein n=1 Tax=Diaporthe citri TaxID=83186 RepID=UPI001C813339|nr:uncharacterized protein INS49_007309 [Diaporthe citri]KAG6365698.1 hypothetical protein INS49_007309 [Diaporthe citri]